MRIRASVVLLSGALSCIAPLGVPPPPPAVLGCYAVTIVGWTSADDDSIGFVPPDRVRLGDLQVAIPGVASWQVLPWWGDVKGSWTNQKSYWERPGVLGMLQDSSESNPTIPGDSLVVTWRHYRPQPWADSVQLQALRGVEFRMAPTSEGFAGAGRLTTDSSGPRDAPLSITMTRQQCIPGEIRGPTVHPQQVLSVLVVPDFF